MDEIIITNGDAPLISQPSPVLIGGEPSIVVQENFVGGQNSTIQIGSVETLPAGSEAYVENVGTETHAILNFGLVTGNTGESGQDGSDGSDGQAATIQIGTVTTGLPNTNASVTNVGTANAAILDFTIPQGTQGIQGIQGVAGVDGISPRAYVEQITGGARVVIEDSETTTTADIMNGVDGTDGTDGTDGFSPIATVTQTSSGATISITDAQGTTTANITNGVDGTDGTDGTDGFSPIATVTQTSSGATISITDAQGTTTANITNGVDGTDGVDGTSATIAVGSTTTGSAGTNASVTNSGTSSAAVFDFVIPRGADGTNGTNGVDGKGFANYSQTEQATDLTWVDGKTIYQKTIYMDSLPNATTKDFNHGASIDYVVDYKGIVTDGSTYMSINAPSVGANNNNAFRTFVTSTYIRIATGQDRRTWSGYVTIYYTK